MSVSGSSLGRRHSGGGRKLGDDYAAPVGPLLLPHSRAPGPLRRGRCHLDRRGWLRLSASGRSLVIACVKLVVANSAADALRGHTIIIGSCGGAVLLVQNGHRFWWWRRRSKKGGGPVVRNDVESPQEKAPRGNSKASQKQSVAKKQSFKDKGPWDCFLTHDWAKDELKRNNHQRVSMLKEALEARGYKTWFDEEMMTGNIERKMMEGIDGSRTIICFVTDRYCEKANGDGEREATTTTASSNWIMR